MAGGGHGRVGQRDGRLRRPPGPEEQAVGGPEFYTGRPGFWAGAVRAAACWYGGARGLVESTKALMNRGDVHALAALGRARGPGPGDARPTPGRGSRRIDEGHADAELGARALREVVHDLCVEVLGAVGAAGGARPLCHDRDQAQRAADLFVYLAQHHAADPATLAGLVLAEPRWG